MKRVDMTNVQESGEFKSVTPGAYICKICAVEDVPEKEYLKVSYDIAAGEFAGYYTETRKAHPDWAWSGAYVKSYKTKALPMLNGSAPQSPRATETTSSTPEPSTAMNRRLWGRRSGSFWGMRNTIPIPAN